MFCRECGREFDDECTECPKCGTIVKTPTRTFVSLVTVPKLPENKDSDWAETLYERHENNRTIGYTDASEESIIRWSVEHDSSYHSLLTRKKADVIKKNNDATKILISVVVGIMVTLCCVVGVIGVNDNATGDDINLQSAGSGILTFEHYGDLGNDISIIESQDLIIFDTDGKYGYYSWIIKDLNHSVLDCKKNSKDIIYKSWVYKGESYSSELSTLVWTTFEAGEYTVTLKCYDTKQSFDNLAVPSDEYSGDLNINGNIVRDYSWIYNNDRFTMSLVFNYQEYVKYKPVTELEFDERKIGSSSFQMSTSFVKIDKTVTQLTNNLVELYKQTSRGPIHINTQDFANFLLSFVQTNFDYPGYYNGINNDSITSDFTLYGKDEYFAYPVETLYHSAGDCEDTSILCAALYKACGYETALLIVPGHAMAAVAIDDFIDPQASGYYLLNGQKNVGEKGNIRFYACETATNVYVPVGLSQNTYESVFTGGGGVYGFFVVTSS